MLFDIRTPRSSIFDCWSWKAPGNRGLRGSGFGPPHARLGECGLTRLPSNASSNEVSGQSRPIVQTQAASGIPLRKANMVASRSLDQDPFPSFPISPFVTDVIGAARSFRPRFLRSRIAIVRETHMRRSLTCTRAAFAAGKRLAFSDARLIPSSAGFGRWRVRGLSFSRITRAGS